MAIGLIDWALNMTLFKLTYFPVHCLTYWRNGTTPHMTQAMLYMSQVLVIIRRGVFWDFKSTIDISGEKKIDKNNAFEYN